MFQLVMVELKIITESKLEPVDYKPSSEKQKV